MRSNDSENCIHTWLFYGYEPKNGSKKQKKPKKIWKCKNCNKVILASENEKRMG